MTSVLASGKTLLVPGVCALLALSTTTAWATEYGNVVTATPIVRPVSVPQTACTQQQVTVQPPQSVGGTVLGTVAGALIGSTIGRGGGQVAATAVGAVAGAVAGHSVDEAQSRPYTAPVQNCQTTSFTQSAVVGYHVTYLYKGKQYDADLPVDPGPSVALRFDTTTGEPVPVVDQPPPPPPIADVPPPPVVVAPAYYVPPVYGTVVIGGGWHR